MSLMTTTANKTLTDQSRRRPLCTLIMVMLVCTGLSPASANGRELDLGVPEDAVLAAHRLSCGTQKEGHYEYGVWRGKIYGRVTWEIDRYLFDVVGVNTRRCPTVVDPQRGTGYRLVSREFMFFLEPGTDTILEVWQNPYTGKEVRVIPVSNDPISFPPVLPFDKNGNPYVFPGEVRGEYVFRSIQARLYYPNPLGGGFDNAVGGFVQGIEIYNHFVPKTELLTDAETPVQNLHLAWHRFSDWTPWMEMGDVPGYLIYSTYGWRAKKVEDLPQILKDAMETEEFALYREPPPADDTRPMTDEYATFKEVQTGEAAKTTIRGQ